MTLPRRMTKEEMVKDFRTSEIADAARRVIGEIGYADTSMDRIAQEARVSKGTLYLYFKNKEDLLGRALDLGFSELMARTRAGTQRARGYRAKLKEAVRAWLKHSTDHRAFLQALQAHGERRLETTSEQIQSLEETYVRFLAGLLARGARAGEFRELPHARLARLLLEILRGAVITRLRESTPPSVDDEVDQIVDFVLHGIGAGDPS